MKNVAKKSTSLKPNNPPQNGLQERLSNGLIKGGIHDVDGTTVEQVSSEADGDNDTNVVTISDDKNSETQDDENARKNSTTFDETSNDSLLEVSCVNVVDDPNVLKSPFNEGHTHGSRSSTPASVTGSSTKRLSGAVNGVGGDHVSDDEVIICEQSSPDAVSSKKTPSSCVRSTSADDSDKWRSNGPVYRVENCEIFENKTEAESDEILSKPDNTGSTISVSDDKDVEVIEVDNSAPAVIGATTTQRSGLKRILSDSSSNDLNQLKKSRLEAAEAEVLTSFVNAQHVTDRENKVVLTAKQLNDLVMTCIEEYLNKSHSSVLKQLKTEIEDLRKSRDHWKVVANQLRKQVALVQTAQQRNERRRSTNSRVQKRSVSCQAYIKIPATTGRSPSRATASANAILDPSKTAMLSNVSTPTQVPGSLVFPSPSVLPPASANLAATQRLKLIHQQNVRHPITGIVNVPSKTVSAMMLPMAVRPPPTMPDSRTVTIDLTAEEDIRLKQPVAADALIPASLISSVVRPGNVVLAPSSSNAYFLYAPPSRSSMLKSGTELDVSGAGSMPTLALGTSMAPGAAYHSLPSLVSVNSRNPGTVLQLVNMRPPPPLQSAPLRTAPQQQQLLPILPALSAPRQIAAPLVHLHHPAPLPAGPAIQSVPAGAKQIPPKPTLKLSRVAQGIVLSWNATINSNQEEPSTYQLYAYQQGVEPASSSLWKKVGNVKALALPMACTLTQFQVGNKYHFAVRAVDQYGRVGPFSEPGSIHLEGGST